MESDDKICPSELEMCMENGMKRSAKVIEKILPAS